MSESSSTIFRGELGRRLHELLEQDLERVVGIVV